MVSAGVPGGPGRSLDALPPPSGSNQKPGRVHREPRAASGTTRHPPSDNPMATTKKSEKKMNPALMKPVQPDEVLAAIVGSAPMPRSEITKKLWDYIKKNGLQDTKVKTNIKADDKLKAVFGGKAVVTMFEMTKLVSAHIKS
jgi:chromatin remodeling complex protein RSC6